MTAIIYITCFLIAVSYQDFNEPGPITTNINGRGVTGTVYCQTTTVRINYDK